MNFLKTPKQKLMEEAGVIPGSDGLLKTPQQSLVEESGIMPRFKKGKKVKRKKPTPAEMQAELIANGKTPPKFKKK